MNRFHGLLKIAFKIDPRAVDIYSSNAPSLMDVEIPSDENGLQKKISPLDRFMKNKSTIARYWKSDDGKGNFYFQKNFKF